MKTILITVDALRADHLSQYGYDRKTMPALDRLTSNGTRFDAAYANGPYTRISVPSLHTSRYLAYDAMDSHPSIATVLREMGVYTACIGTQVGFSEAQGTLAFDEYRDLGRDDFHDRAKAEQPVHHDIIQAVEPLVERSELASRLAGSAYNRLRPIVGTVFRHLGYTSAADVTDHLIEWLDAHADEEFFLWVHYMEGHRPYGVHDTNPKFLESPIPEAEIKRLMKLAGTSPSDVTIEDHHRLIDLYDSNLTYCSRHLDRLFDHLEVRNLWNETDIIFTSDHGEEFYDHGEYFHRNLPYDELLHVPLITKTDSLETDVVTETRELLDIAPTIASRHGVPPERHDFLGEPLSVGGERSVIAVGSQISDEHVVCIRTSGWKYICIGDDALLFDLEEDPRERHSVADEYPDIASELRTQIPTRVLEADAESLREPESAVDRERLEALGYLEIGE